MTKRLPLPTAATRVAGAATVLVIAATAAYLKAAYAGIPYAIPMRFSNGEPFIFARKTPAMVYLPAGIQLALAATFAAVVLLLLWRARPQTPDAVPSDDARRMQHAAEAVALLGLVWITFQAVSAWRLVELWTRGYGGLGEIYGFALVTALTATIVVFARAVVLVGHGTQAPLPIEAGSWRGHYVDRSNPALFVPVAGGGTLTVNFGRSITAFLLVLVLGAGIGGPFYLAFAAFRGVLGNLLY
jgi:uncharacterized membrane protein